MKRCGLNSSDCFIGQDLRNPAATVHVVVGQGGTGGADHFGNVSLIASNQGGLLPSATSQPPLSVPPYRLDLPVCLIDIPLHALVAELGAVDEGAAGRRHTWRVHGFE